MRMDSRLILGGQTPDMVGSLDRGFTAGRRRGLADLYAEHGQDIAAGGQNGLNALAGFDPNAALNVQQTQQGMKHADTRMGYAAENMDWQRADRARAGQERMDAEQARKRLAQTEKAIALMNSAQTPEQWDQIARISAPELVGQFGNKEALLAKVLPIAEVLKMQIKRAETPKTPASYEALRLRAQSAGLQEGTPEFQQFMANGGMPKNSRIAVGADGSIEITEGTGTTNLPKTTEGEKGSAGYLSRMRASESLLDDLSERGVDTRSIASLLIGDTNFAGMLSPEQGQLLQAQQDWVRAKLRKESGAVIGAEEMAAEIRTYFPLPNEGPEVIAQKRAARKQAERQLEIMSGNAASQAGPAATATTTLPTVPDFTQMSDEELDAYIASGGNQ